jgi:hypothetical protein
MGRGLELPMELFHGIASIGGLFGWFHPSIVRPDPVSRVSVALSAECQQPFQQRSNAYWPTTSRTGD